MRFLSLVLALATAAAQTPPASTSGPAKSLIGEVTAVDAAAKQIKIKADNGGAYTVGLDENTAYLRVPPGEKDLKKATKIALTDIAVGDRLLARGTVSEETKTVPAKTVIIMTKGDIAQKHERDRAEWQRRGVAGTISAVNPETKEVTVTTRGREAATVAVDASAAEFRRYAPDSVRFSDAKPGTFAELHVGDSLRALGNKDDSGKYKAEEIVSGSFQTIAGTVISVDAANNEVRITDLQTKKPVTVRINKDSALKRLPEQMATMMAMRMRGGSMAGGPPGAQGRPREAGAGPPDAANTERRGYAPGGAGSPSGGPGGPGPGGRGPGGGNFDLQQILERMPALQLSELKKGDALIVSSTKGVDISSMTAITLVAGVEPFLAAAPRSAGQVNLGSWSLDVGMPEQ